MISGFSDVSLSPNTNDFYLLIQQEKTNVFLEHIIFGNSFENVGKGGGGGATNPDHPSNRFLKILIFGNMKALTL